MPPTARNLYYDLGMECDDDGYCEYYNVMLIPPYKNKDLQELEKNGFIMIFDEHVLGITHNNDNNQIRKDRKKDSKYKDIFDMTTKCQPNDNQVSTKCPHSIVEDSIGKVSKEKNSELIDKVILLWNEVAGESLNLKSKQYREAVSWCIDQFNGLGDSEKLAKFRYVFELGDSEKLAKFRYVFENKKRMFEDDNHPYRHYELPSLLGKKKFMGLVDASPYQPLVVNQEPCVRGEEI
jgi:hypothetical protein